MTTFAPAPSDAPTADPATEPAGDPASAAGTLALDAAAGLIARAGVLGLNVGAVAYWPAGDDDLEPPPLPAFIVSAFSPMIAEVATRCLTAATAGPDRPKRDTAIVVMSPLGDIASAEYVADAVAGGTRIGPLMFFQAVPNAVAGLIAARWGLAGPMVSLGAADGGIDVAAALISDGDATGALVLLAEADPNRAVALVVTGRDVAGDGRSTGDREGES